MSFAHFVVFIFALSTVGWYLRRKEKEGDALVVFIEKTYGQRLEKTIFTESGVTLRFQKVGEADGESISFSHRGGRNPDWCRSSE